MPLDAYPARQLAILVVLGLIGLHWSTRKPSSKAILLCFNFVSLPTYHSFVQTLVILIGPAENYLKWQAIQLAIQ